MSSDRWVPRSKSHWSSERDRARRNRKDQGQPGESDRGSESGEPTPDASETPQPTEQPGERSSTERIDRLTADVGRSSRRSRSSRTAPDPEPSGGSGSDEPPSTKLPDLPGSSGSGKSGGSRVLVLGALLFIAMAAIAVLPRILGDGGDADPTPTPQLIQTPTPRSESAANPATGPTKTVQDAEHVVCIDAGHGGWDPGRKREANSRAPMMEESDINLGMAWMLKERLEQEGIGVVMTRPDGLAVNTFNQDVNGDGQTLQDSQQAGDRDELQARINICNEANAELLISVHLNGFDDASARGYEVLYTPAPFRDFGDRNADLATFIYREIDAAYREVGFDTQPRGTLPDTELDAELHEYGSERHLVMTGPEVSNADYTITPSSMPGVVIEPVFITNDDDAAFIAETSNQQLLVNAYADGITNYFERYPDGL